MIKLNVNASFGGSGNQGIGWSQQFWIGSTSYPVTNEAELDAYLASVKAHLLKKE
jgi:hypothetical protein